MGPDGEDALFEFLKGRLEGWHGKLIRYRDMADTGSYPGARDIADGLSLVNALLVPGDSNKFLAQFIEHKNELLDLTEGFHDLEQFYEHQRPMWDKLRAASSKFELNQMELERNEPAGSALRRMNEILSTASPYGLIREAEGLISTVREVNEELLSVRRAQVLATINQQDRRCWRGDLDRRRG